MTSFRLDGKVAIVTGGGGGIGVAYGRGLAQAGAQVALADINQSAVEAAAADMVAEGLDVIGVRLDVTDPESAAAAVAATVAAFGGLDILVNNAALMAEIESPSVLELPLESWNRVLAVNTTGPLICARAAVPEMLKRGGGKIVNQVSGGAFMAGSGAYGVSKLALVSLTTQLATELGPKNINVNAIAPGFVSTEAGFRAAPEDSMIRQMIRQMVPLRAEAPAEDLVGPLLLLVSDAGSWITGQTIGVDGGWIMRI